jgi:hypothetical protein
VTNATDVTDMTEQPTCGQGLAAHAMLPIKLGELTAAVAENLEAHLPGLDLSDEHAAQEHRVYVKLAQEHRQIAARLNALGEEMAGYRDLPMGRHDMEALSSPQVAEAFQQFVRLEQELVALLQQRLQEDQGMLAAMDEAGLLEPPR